MNSLFFTVTKYGDIITHITGQLGFIKDGEIRINILDNELTEKQWEELKIAVDEKIKEIKR